MSYQEALEAALRLKNALKEIESLIEQQIASAADAEAQRIAKAA